MIKKGGWDERKECWIGLGKWAFWKASLNNLITTMAPPQKKHPIVKRNKRGRPSLKEKRESETGVDPEEQDARLEELEHVPVISFRNTKMKHRSRGPFALTPVRFLISQRRSAGRSGNSTPRWTNILRWVQGINQSFSISLIKITDIKSNSQNLQALRPWKRPFGSRRDSKSSHSLIEINVKLSKLSDLLWSSTRPRMGPNQNLWANSLKTYDSCSL